VVKIEVLILIVSQTANRQIWSILNFILITLNFIQNIFKAKIRKWISLIIIKH